MLARYPLIRDMDWFLYWGPLICSIHYYCTPGDCIQCACMHAVKKRRLENSGIKEKRQDRDGV